MYIIIGGRGRLARSLAKTTSDLVHNINYAIYSEWWDKNGKKKIMQYFKEKKITQGTILVAAGMLDPAQSMSEHERINYLLPKHIIEGLSVHGFKTITFGTVMEHLIGNKTYNPYIISKMHLSRFVQECAIKKIPVLHIRLHTLYGGIDPPQPFMFLGQLLHAMNTKSDFKMTGGEQLREYHHIEDAAKAIFQLIKRNLTGVTQLNHGKPEKLKDIACHVLNYFGNISLLQLDTEKKPLYENYGIIFKPFPDVKDMVFRDTLSGIVEYFKFFVAK